MSTLRTTQIIHGSSAISNIVLDNQGRAIFRPDSPQGRAALYVNAQTNRVGVNTESPAVALDVDGAINATGNVAFAGTLNVTGDFSVASSVLFVDVDKGSVGINTTTFNAESSGRNILELAGGAGGALINLTTQGTRRGYLFATDPNVYLYNVGTGFLDFGTDNLSRMQIDSSGRVLVGGSTPYVTDATLQIRDDTNPKFVISNPGNATYSLAVGTDNDLLFKNESTAVDNMRLDYNGFLIVGDEANANTTISPNGGLVCNYKFGGVSTNIITINSGDPLALQYGVDQYGAISAANGYFRVNNEGQSGGNPNGAMVDIFRSGNALRIFDIPTSSATPTVQIASGRGTIRTNSNTTLVPVITSTSSFVPKYTYQQYQNNLNIVWRCAQDQNGEVTIDLSSAGSFLYAAGTINMMNIQTNNGTILRTMKTMSVFFNNQGGGYFSKTDLATQNSSNGAAAFDVAWRPGAFELYFTQLASVNCTMYCTIDLTFGCQINI